MTAAAPQTDALTQGQADELVQEAKTLMRKLQPRKAIDALASVLKQHPKHQEAWTQYGACLWELKQRQDGFSALQTAIGLDPSYHKPYLFCAIYLQKEGKYAEALDYFLKAEKAAPTNAKIQLNLGVHYHMQNQSADALPHLHRALELGADASLVWNNIGNALQALGRDEEACEAFRKAYEAAPGPRSSYILRNYTRSAKMREGDPMLDATRDVLANPKAGGVQRMYAHYALAKTYEDMKNLPAAFDAYKEANDFMRAQLTYQPEEHLEYSRSICRAFTPEVFAEFTTKAPSDERTPIFIIGMPRSGTSLTEQILASHSRVFGAGELMAIPAMAQHNFAGVYGKKFPHYLPDMKPDHIAHARDYYLQQLRAYHATAPHVTDKLPNNYRYVGLIQILFPNSPIIHCTRDPVDVCWSLYRLHFDERHPYSYDLRELGQVYNMYREMMAHWHKVLPGRIYDISYEALVDDLEGEARKLLDYCGLAWESSVLDYQKTERNINTASSAQARKPLYKTSMKSWEPIADKLAPLIEMLREGGSLV